MSELIDALNQLQKEKNIEKEVIMQAIEDSLVAACNRDFGKNAIVKVNMDRETGGYLCLCGKDSSGRGGRLRHGVWKTRRCGISITSWETLSTSR